MKTLLCQSRPPDAPPDRKNGKQKKRNKARSTNQGLTAAPTMLKPERAPDQRNQLTAGANISDQAAHSIKDLSNNSLIDK